MQNQLTLDQQTMIDNLREYINNNSSSLTEFASAHNIYLSNLSNILNGKRKFSTKLARELEGKLDLEKGYFTRQKNNTVKIPFQKIDEMANNIIFDKAHFSIELNLLTQNNQYNSLFAIHPSINLDRAAVISHISKSDILIFDSDKKELINNKIYLLRYKSQIIIRIFDENNYFTTDMPEIYASIPFSDEIELLGRLLYTINIEEK